LTRSEAILANTIAVERGSRFRFDISRIIRRFTYAFDMPDPKSSVMDQTPWDRAAQICRNKLTGQVQGQYVQRYSAQSLQRRWEEAHRDWVTEHFQCAKSLILGQQEKGQESILSLHERVFTNWEKFNALKQTINAASKSRKPALPVVLGLGLVTIIVTLLISASTGLTPAVSLFVMGPIAGMAGAVTRSILNAGDLENPLSYTLLFGALCGLMVSALDLAAQLSAVDEIGNIKHISYSILLIAFVGCAAGFAFDRTLKQLAQGELKSSKAETRIHREADPQQDM